MSDRPKLDWEGEVGVYDGYKMWAEFDRRRGACVYVSNQRDPYESFDFSSVDEIDEFINRLQRAREWLRAAAVSKANE